MHVPYHDVWLRKCKNCELLDFFIWLEDQNVSIFLPSINCLSKDELEEYKVLIRDGKFYSTDGGLITTEDLCAKSNPKHAKSITKVNFRKEPIFVIDANKNMFLTCSDEKNAHVTLSSYLPLIGSGKIYLKKGIVEKISFESGHYLPKMKHFVQVIRFFENNGVHLDDDIEIIYYIGYKDYVSTLKEFKKEYMHQDYN